MVEIEYSPKFARAYAKLPRSTKDAAEEKEEIFRQNPFDPRLKTHKLSGQLKNYWAFAVDYRCRIIFSFEGKGLVRFHTVGTHDIYGIS
jgi:mRNA-degrading endonuclease YafQ of YafQ-DinJ toxin-antitoxin module